MIPARTLAPVACAVLIATAACSPRQADLVYDTHTSGSPAPAHANDLVHFGFGAFRAVGGPVQLWAIDSLQPTGFRAMGQGFVAMHDSSGCMYTYGMNGYHPCPDVVSLAERPILQRGQQAWIVLTVLPTEEGRHPIGPVEVHYTSGDVTRSLTIHPKDYLRTADPFLPKNPKPPNACHASGTAC